MSNKTIALDAFLYQYMLDMSLREPPLLQRLRADTARLPSAYMQIAPEQGQFMGLLVRLMRAQRAIEVGTFTGYSTLVVALALPPSGRLVACDVNTEWTAKARQYWQEAGVAEKIELRLAPALATLDALLAEQQAGTFDFAFILVSHNFSA
jgi:caffeoyl-CoA O-methyltransferase